MLNYLIQFKYINFQQKKNIFLKQYQIEENLSNIVNQLLVNVYEDPYSYLVLKLEDVILYNFPISFKIVNN